MSSITRITHRWTLGALVLAILATRVNYFQHFETAFTLPDATLAVFFLAGLWARSGWAFPVLLLAAAGADQLAFLQGVSDWCVTPAYVFLIPTYACLWWAGYVSRQLQWTHLADAARGAGYLLSAIVAAFVISTGSFFLLSGYFAGVSGLEYGLASLKYFPRYAGWAVAYSGFALIVAECVRRPRPGNCSVRAASTAYK